MDVTVIVMILVVCHGQLVTFASNDLLGPRQTQHFRIQYCDKKKLQYFDIFQRVKKRCKVCFVIFKAYLGWPYRIRHPHGSKLSNYRNTVESR
jgi:hypothetical protein